MLCWTETSGKLLLQTSRPVEPKRDDDERPYNITRAWISTFLEAVLVQNFSDLKRRNPRDSMCSYFIL